MLNPFKKKEDSYKLDEMTLPSMGSQSSTNQDQQNDNVSQQIPPSFDNHPASVDNNENSQMAADQPFNENQFPSQNTNTMNSSFSNPQQPSFSNPSYEQQSNFSQSPTNQNEFSSNSINQSSDMSAVQLETLDKKISLLDTRMNIMEDKINKIYEMLTLEVSEDTRTKVHINIDKSRFSK